ncbi:MAG: glycosyltransferase [Acidimicrobiia bacterium]|nr:glycosyltransferase [Acidimicrobiia bacterium]
MPEAPIVTVVIPTRGRAGRLAALVAALERQESVAAFEVVFVDDASPDHTPLELQRLAETSSIPIRCLTLEHRRGQAAARNVGWRAARAPLVAFTDDDCRPTPEWLGRLVAGLAHADLVQGRTLPDPDDAACAGPFSRTVETTQEWGFYETCNIAYRKEALARVAGFDEGFRGTFGEDTDLAWRVKDSGGRSSFEPGAVVYHAVWPQSFVTHLRDLPRRAGMVRVLSRNPSLRSRLPRRWLWEQSHRPALAAGAGLGLLAARRTPGTTLAAAALLVPYLDYRARVEPLGPPGRQPLLIPQALAADLFEIAVLAVASVRYRTLLL